MLTHEWHIWMIIPISTLKNRNCRQQSSFHRKNTNCRQQSSSHRKNTSEKYQLQFQELAASQGLSCDLTFCIKASLNKAKSQLLRFSNIVNNHELNIFSPTRSNTLSKFIFYNQFTFNLNKIISDWKLSYFTSLQSPSTVLFNIDQLFYFSIT